MYEKVLVPLDGSRFAEHALLHALPLAEAWGAAVELASVATTDFNPGEADARGGAGDDLRERAMERVSEYLTAVKERVREGGYAGELTASVIPPGNVIQGLVRHLHEVGADFLVLTSHGRGPVQRAWLGSVADGLIRRSPSPLLLIRPNDQEGGEPLDLARRSGPFARTLVPLDGSAPGERLLRIAKPLLEPGEEGVIVLLRAVPPFIPGGSPYLPHMVREGREHELVLEAARGYVEEVAERVREEGRAVEIRVVTAPQPAMAILDAAEEEEVDLIAMSTHGRGGVARLLLGSVADKVVRGSKVPVLLYREAEGG